MIQKRKVFTDANSKLVHRTGPGQYAYVDRAQMNQGTQLKIDQALLDQLAGMGASGSELDLIADLSALVQELTVTGVVRPTARFIELNHVDTPIAATMVAPKNAVVVVKDTSLTGVIEHTFTVTGGTLDGTLTIATFNLLGDCIIVYFDSAGHGIIVENIGAVGLG